MEVSYQRQSFEKSRRTCGAACLSMVYESFGKRIPQDEIWPAIAKQNEFGSSASTTHLMVEDAQKRGFGAVAIQARHPLQALRICRATGTQAILNLRLQKNVPAGHYSVLVDIDAGGVTLHDPLSGPSHRMSYVELLQLWQPWTVRSEISGHVLIAIAETETPAGACRVCGLPVSKEIECPNCHKGVSLHPAAVLGCMGEACVGRMWNYICCPACDGLFDLNGKKTGLATGSADTSLGTLFGAIEKFAALIAGVPQAASHIDVKTQLDFMASTREKLESAYGEEVAGRTMILDQLAELGRSTGEKRQQAREKLAQMDRPLPRLDGHELGQALLRNLGLSV